MSNIFIISGPSGAGEDSVIKGLREIFPIEKMVTTTTREIRPGEVDGVDYYFISKDKFQAMITEGKFFEWAEEDNGQLYGGTLEEIEKVKHSKNIVIWKIEYQGAIAAKKILPEAISIFIYIPMEKIRERLEIRGIHSEDFINSRLEYAQGWFDNEAKFNYKVENVENELDKTIEKVANIIRKNRN